MSHRFQVYIKPNNWKTLKNIKTITYKSMSTLINEAIHQTYKDPIKVLIEERKDHADKINQLTDKIKRLEKQAEEDGSKISSKKYKGLM